MRYIDNMRSPDVSNTRFMDTEFLQYRSLDALKKAAQIYINKKWQLYGGLHMALIKTPSGNIEIEYTQTIVKYQEKK